MLGFIFYRPVNRFIDPEQVAEIVEACRGQFHDWQAVGVFVNEPIEQVNAISQACKLDLVQLAGEESPEYCQQLGRPAIKVLRIREGRWDADRLREARAGYRVNRFMIDSHVSGYYGGTGVASDWESLPTMLGSDILAGGLRPENVEAALSTTTPWGVDVSTGVEREGRKDPVLIQRFIQAVRRHDAKPAVQAAGSR
jgi:phosphoribosylanthranilate isomerase